MKKIILAIFVILCAFIQNISFSQEENNNESDYRKLYIEYKSALDSDKSAQNYLNMCQITFSLNDFDTAKIYCKSALNEIEKEKNPDYELKSEILSTLGDIYSTYYTNTDITFDYYNQAKEYKENNPDTDKCNLAKLYKNISYTYGYKGNEILAKEYEKKASELLDNLIKNNVSDNQKAKLILAVLYNNVAEKYIKDKEFETANEYLNKSIKLLISDDNSNKYNDDRVLARTYKNLAQIFDLKRDKNSAIEYYRKSLSHIAKFPDKNLLSKEEELPENTTIEDILNLLKEFPYDVDLNVMAGSYYIPSNKQKSREYFQKAVNVNPENAYVYAAIAEAYSSKYSEANFKEYANFAKEYMLKAEKYANYEPDIYLTLGLVNINLKSIVTANMYFDYYIKYSEDKTEANCEVASVFWYNDIKKKYRKYVIYYLEKAKKTDKEIGSLYKLMLITAYKQIGNTKKADELATQLLNEESVFSN